MVDYTNLDTDEMGEDDTATLLTEVGFTTAIGELVEAKGSLFDHERQGDVEVQSVRTFEDAGVLTRNAGLVIRMVDGTEFQVTVVRSR